MAALGYSRVCPEIFKSKVVFFLLFPEAPALDQTALAHVRTKLSVSQSFSKRAQYPLITGKTLNHIQDPYIIQGSIP